MSWIDEIKAKCEEKLNLKSVTYVDYGRVGSSTKAIITRKDGTVETITDREDVKLLAAYHLCYAPESDFEELKEIAKKFLGAEMFQKLVEARAEKPAEPGPLKPRPAASRFTRQTPPGRSGQKGI